MAGRRFAVKSIDWIAFAERVPPNQKTMFNALKTRSDLIASKLTSLPEKPPAIDWAYYRTAIAKAGMVDEFEKKTTQCVINTLHHIFYTTSVGHYKLSVLAIPEPKDTQTEKINAQAQEAEKSAANYIQESKDRVSTYERELLKYQNMIPFDQMTVDEYTDAFPGTKLDTEKNVYWPHKPISDL